jgi:hypothetical protein
VLVVPASTVTPWRTSIESVASAGVPSWSVIAARTPRVTASSGQCASGVPANLLELISVCWTPGAGQGGTELPTPLHEPQSPAPSARTIAVRWRFTGWPAWRAGQGPRSAGASRAAGRLRSPVRMNHPRSWGHIPYGDHDPTPSKPCRSTDGAPPGATVEEKLEAIRKFLQSRIDRRRPTGCP